MSLKKTITDAISTDRVKDILVELVKVPSPQTDKFESEPLLAEFIRNAVEPRLRKMGITDIRYDKMDNLISTYGADTTGKSLMLISNAMNQPQSTMVNAYDGDVVDGAKYELPGEVVLGKGASEQKGTMAAMLHAMETIIASDLPINGQLVFLCCVSGETGRHDAITSVVEGEGVRADMAILGGTSLKLTLGNRGRIDSFVKVKGSPGHSSAPNKACNAITGAREIIDRLEDQLELTGEHPALGTPTFAVNHIRSFPDSTHTIQGECEITLDRRLLPGDDPHAKWQEIRDIVMQVDGMEDPASGQKWQVEMTEGPFMYPSLVEMDSPIVQTVCKAAEEVLGAAPETFYTTTAFDQGYLNHVGIPCANYGSGEDQFAHTDDDCSSVDRTRDTAKVFAYMIADYLG
ncbi:MAG: M20 family metallopeptidase [Alphaproteobacteria bacterium]|jgi:acetylornithine deacetylase/succinyl-diaminopimelate desuccinylase-like protein